METSLHQTLKAAYAGSEQHTEVNCQGFRIDAITENVLVEIQHSSLAAIRRKIASLLQENNVLVVKPLVIRKKLMVRKRKNGPVTSERYSPRRGQAWDLFDELIHFTDVFPHPRLCLEVLLVEVEEWRRPAAGRRRWRKPYLTEDVKLVSISHSHCLQTAADLVRLLPVDQLPQPFHTGHLAELLEVSRGMAQRMAYCFRKIQAVNQVGKRGNALLYEWTPDLFTPPACTTEALRFPTWNTAFLGSQTPLESCLVCP